MSDRILNFSEFFKRYSKQTNKENSLDTIISSPQNFEDGFDETTYDKTQLGPNKPISTKYQETPAQPNFSKEKDEQMEAPEFNIEVESEETPEPEKMGANPKPEKTEKTKEKVAESRILSFESFFNKPSRFSSISESEEEENPYSGLAEMEPYSSMGMNPGGEDVYEEDLCPSCGNPMAGTYTAAANPGMKTCGGNPMSGGCGQ